jgi:hypothetical protein
VFLQHHPPSSRAKIAEEKHITLEFATISNKTSKGSQIILTSLINHIHPSLQKGKGNGTVAT